MDVVILHMNDVVHKCSVVSINIMINHANSASVTCCAGRPAQVQRNPFLGGKFSITRELYICVIVIESNTICKW